MVGNLNESEIDNILSSQTVGRIACIDGKHPYIIPVSYTYDGEYIYGQTREGIKLRILRKNPNICFEADVMMDMANWKSVVIRGVFEELKGDEAEKTRAILSKKFFTLMTGFKVHHHQHDVTSVIDDSNHIKPVLYRIRIKQKSGRFQDQQCNSCDSCKSHS